MSHVIKRINLGGVNCYLIRVGSEFILIDTGFAARRAKLEQSLVDEGCWPGHLALILLTHGDEDHAANAAFLREQYGAPIAIHECDAGMVTRGDMGWNRKAKPDRVSAVFKLVMWIASRFQLPSSFETFEPDFVIDESFNLTRYGLDARVLHLPGHSKGSIGVLTAEGELFCGDLLYHIFGKPQCHLIDDLADYTASIEKLRGLEVNTVYPGHGKPFAMAQFMKSD